MYKTLFAYILTLTLLSTVAIPTYFSITEEIYESSLVIDIEEDTDGNEKSEKNELKIISLPLSFSSSCVHFSSEKTNSYQSNQYNSVSSTLESPPPEYC
ncbi:hypothetical protein H3Z83_06215 [Tenacibaculum sp. S7007]|uniref:Uncharacterized protein n=1 Tax=Tenacibaculum pelagium TaxID=2759527 RepID=A0A839APL4_9FLAO|nr:hypothetical protein [Tenacibaculum pelagium]MBA6156114.1 hypothetical protein [Tenacibaculum pelagium]